MFLLRESQGWGSLVGSHLWGRTESDMIEATQQQQQQQRQKILRRGGKNTQKNGTKKKNLHDTDNHDGVITHLEPDILEWDIKWVLESITMNKAVMEFQLSYFKS